MFHRNSAQYQNLELETKQSNVNQHFLTFPAMASIFKEWNIFVVAVTYKYCYLFLFPHRRFLTTPVYKVASNIQSKCSVANTRGDPECNTRFFQQNLYHVHTHTHTHTKQHLIIIIIEYIGLYTSMYSHLQGSMAKKNYKVLALFKL